MSNDSDSESDGEIDYDPSLPPIWESARTPTTAHKKKASKVRDDINDGEDEDKDSNYKGRTEFLFSRKPKPTTTTTTQTTVVTTNTPTPNNKRVTQYTNLPYVQRSRVHNNNVRVQNNNEETSHVFFKRAAPFVRVALKQTKIDVSEFSLSNDAHGKFIVSFQLKGYNCVITFGAYDELVMYHDELLADAILRSIQKGLVELNEEIRE